MKTTFVILEGPKGVGKSTLRPFVQEAFDQQAHVVDRLVGSMWVFDRIYRRRFRETVSYLYELNTLASIYDVVQVVLHAPEEELRNRLLRRDLLSVYMYDVKLQARMFRLWHHLCSERSATTTLLVPAVGDPAETAQAIRRHVNDRSPAT